MGEDENRLWSQIGGFCVWGRTIVNWLLRIFSLRKSNKPILNYKVKEDPITNWKYLRFKNSLIPLHCMIKKYLFPDEATVQKNKTASMLLENTIHVLSACKRQPSPLNCCSCHILHSRNLKARRKQLYDSFEEKPESWIFTVITLQWPKFYMSKEGQEPTPLLVGRFSPPFYIFTVRRPSTS